MLKDCKNCSAVSYTVTELLRIYESHDAPRMMSILTETIATDTNLHPRDREILSHMMHLVISLMKEQSEEQQAEILSLKKTA